MAATTTTGKDTKGLFLVYLPANQAWLLTWCGQPLRIGPRWEMRDEMDRLLERGRFAPLEW
jgi:hypothetical protein